MKITSLRELFEHEIQDLYSTETQIIEALPKMISAASSDALKTALQEHLDVTKEQRQRLEKIGEQCECSVQGEDCMGIKGILTEGSKALKEISDPATKDAAIIASAQRVEHYEIAAYGSAREFANTLELSDAEDLLAQTLDEEKDADASLTSLAEGGLFQSGLNQKALE